MYSLENIKRLLDKVREINESQRNKKNKKFWEIDEKKEIRDDEFRVIPKRIKGECPPFYAELSVTMYVKILGFSGKNYYSNPLSYLENYLRMMIFNYQEFPDDNYIQKKIRIMYAATLEGTLFGLNYGVTEDGNIWLDNEPLIKEKSDLAKIDLPDFYSSGLMPGAIEFYEKITEVAGDDFTVTFPAWVMGPFGVACRLRGFGQFLIDILEDREFTKELLDFIIESRISWTIERSNYLNRPWYGCSLGNDDISCPTLSPEMYNVQILPFERKLAEFYKRLFYWHSCGDCTQLLSKIRNLSPISLLHVGPWTNIKTAADVFGKDTPLEICLKPDEDVLQATTEDKKKRLDEIKEACKDDLNCYIRLDSFDTSQKDCMSAVKKIRSYLQFAKEYWKRGEKV
jgi:hypothetical protein